MRKQVALAVNSQSKLCYLPVSTIFAGEKENSVFYGMKYIVQFEIILAISLVGELLNRVIPLPVPASIYGMILLFACLFGGVIKLSDIKETAVFLVETMPVLFIPAEVGLIASWNTLLTMLAPTIVIMCVTLIMVMVVTGRTSQMVIRMKKKTEMENGANE